MAPSLWAPSGGGEWGPWGLGYIIAACAVTTQITLKASFGPVLLSHGVILISALMSASPTGNR